MNELQQRLQQRQVIASEIYRFFCCEYAGISIAEAKACLDEAKTLLELKATVESLPKKC